MFDVELKLWSSYQELLVHICKVQHQESHEPVAEIQEDGTYLYKRESDGRLETWEDRQKRLQHNLKMQFNRSFTASTLAEHIYTYIYINKYI